MAITAKDVQALREMTGVGMMDCKKALTEAEGDMDKAVEILREKGLAASQKKAGRIAAEGMAYATVVNGVGVVVEVNAETDFVGTKKQAQEAIKEEATRCGGYYVNARWLGGMLTNFKTMRGRVDRLNQLKKMQEDGTFDMLPKKEVMKHLGEIAKLEKYLGGVVEMKKLPGALFVVDPRKERNAINEARKLHIPIVAIVDTNCDPDEIDYVIPGNDDAIRAIKLISSVMANAIQEGKQGQDEAPAAEEAAPAAAEQ